MPHMATQMHGSWPRRMLVCRLAGAAITADECVSADERMVYSHVPGRWQTPQPRVTQAVLHEPTR